MSPVEVAAVLRYASSLDPWLRASDPEAGQLMVAGWSSILAEVPHDFALQTTRRHYSVAEPRTLQPGDVLAAWQAHQRLERAREEQVTRALDAAARRGDIDVGDAIPVGGAVEYLAALSEAYARGEDPRTVPRPAGVRVLSAEADERSRRCRWHDLPCVCTHTECRDGWLDEEEVIVNGNGQKYPAVKPCPVCHEALVMAEERGLTRKPVSSGRRR